jgi:hypothetical protein
LLGIFAIILGTRIVLQFPAVFYEKAVRVYPIHVTAVEHGKPVLPPGIPASEP